MNGFLRFCRFLVFSLVALTLWDVVPETFDVLPEASARGRKHRHAGSAHGGRRRTRRRTVRRVRRRHRRRAYRRGAYYASLPKGYTVVVVSGSTYYYYSGTYYVKATNQGKEEYKCVDAPAGATVKEISKEAEKISFNGKTHYFDLGDCYVQVSGGYQAVQPPIGMKVKDLPEEAEDAEVGGKSYIYTAGSFYAEEGETHYKVVPAPNGAQVKSIPESKESVGNNTFRVYGVSYQAVMVGGEVRYQVGATSASAAPAATTTQPKKQAPPPKSAPQVSVDAIVAELGTALKLSGTRSGQIKLALIDYSKALKGALKKNDKDKPDPKDLIADIGKAYDPYRTTVQNILSKDQWSAHEKYADKMQKGIIGGIAKDRLLEMQRPLNLSNEQIEKLAPILTKSMLTMFKIGISTAGKRLGPMKKRKLGKKLQQIQSDTQAAIAGVLTTEQIEKMKKHRSG